MNISASILKKSLCILSVVAASVIASSTAHAQILLTVDITNPDAVVITATGSLPSAAVSGASSLGGIELLNFFTAPDGGDTIPASSGNLATTNVGAVAFDYWAVDLDPVANAQIGLDIYNNENAGSLTFDLGKAAFTGSLTLDLSGRPIPTALTLGSPTGGAIIVGNSGAVGDTIGSWQVVQAPEPSTWVMLVGSLLVLPFIQRLRRQA